MKEVLRNEGHKETLLSEINPNKYREGCKGGMWVGVSYISPIQVTTEDPRTAMWIDFTKSITV